MLNLKIKTATISEFTYSKYRHFYLSVQHVTWKSHCKENHICIFLFRESRGLSSNFHIHVSVSDLHFPGSVHTFPCSKIRRPILKIYKSLKGIRVQWWANLDQASKDLDKTIFRDLSPTPIP
jgi:hypothetical protein